MKPPGGEFTAYELQRIRVIQDAVAGRITAREAAQLLQLSTRQVKRLKQKCRTGAIDWMFHGNSGRPRPWRISDEVRTRVLELSEGKYAGLNDSQLCRALAEHEGINIARETVRRLLRRSGRPSPVGPGRPAL